MKTTKVVVDVDRGKFTVNTQDDEVTFNVFKAAPQKKEPPECLKVDSTEGVSQSNTESPLQGVKREEADYRSTHKLRKKKIKVLNKKLRKRKKQLQKSLVEANFKRKKTRTNVNC
ncbi:hypothetical protein SESBI_26265 [Sesbania bispinosa]|nr:hypothetical protein SESBI_26265 [Sesbania bispinosa]